MEIQKQLPKVLLVGRTNVGKSTLFNRLTNQKISIVFEREGVTRDYLQEVVSWKDNKFLLIDSGGFSFNNTNVSEIDKEVQKKVHALIDQCHVYLFVVDGKNGLTNDDLEVAKVLRKQKKPIALLVNKADNPNAVEDAVVDCYKLGFDPIIPVSAIHSIGTIEVLSFITENLPELEEIQPEKPAYKITIIGRPNVGKSSLMNLLIAKERSIVSAVAGTTREAITDVIYHCNDLVQLTDTAGVRRSRKVDDDLEKLMVKSSMQAVRDSDIVIAMIDASQGAIADQEIKLLFYAYEQHKMILAVINKTDLLDDYTMAQLKDSVDKYQFIFKKIPVLWTSCATKKNVNKIFSEIKKIWVRNTQIFDPIVIDEVLKNELDQRHLMHTTIELKVKKIIPMQRENPSFVLYVNHPQWFGESERGCIENILRRHYDLLGCPVLLFFKKEVV